MANDVLSLLCDRNESKKTTYMNGLNELFALCKTVKLETVQIVNLMEKENHPFKVIDDASMKALAESISRVGVMQPIIVRPAGGCKYEILSGHRRTRASELCGKTEIDAVIVEADDELANRIVILTNFHQRTIRYPSEIAKSYQIRYNDLKKRKNSTGWNCEPDKLDRIMEREFATSKSKIYMYLRLNYLTDTLLEALDNKKIKLKAAVELSYVSVDIQNIIYDYVVEREIYKLNVRKAGKIKRLSIEKEVSEEDIQKILSDDEKIKNDIYFGTSEIEKYKHMVVAECGSGKTKIGSVGLAAHQNGRKCFNVVLCPSHVTKKWVREIEETLPDTKAEVVYSLADIDRVHDEYINGDKTIYAILSKERARDGYMRRPAAVYSKSKKGYICPSCGAILKMPADDDSGMMVRADQFFFKKENGKNHVCEECKEPLWTAINPKDQKLSHNKWIKIAGYGFVYRDFAHRHLEKTKDLKVIDRINDIINNPEEVIRMRGAYLRYSMSDYIAERFKQIDGSILDELHQFKGDSGQGDAMETLAGCSKKVIGMTATLVNGYSSGMFYLLYRVVPRLMQIDNKTYDKPNAFNNEYGVTETVYELPDSEYNANSKSKKKLLHTRQKPGVSPLVYSRFLIDCAVFLSLNDMGKHLPDYEEIPVELELRADIKQEYDRIQNKYRNCLNRRDGSQMKLMSKFMSILTTYPDQPYAHEPICEPRDKSVIVEPKDLSNPEEMHEKDVATLDIVKRKVANGEKVLIYTSWVKIDAQDRITKYLTDNGYKVAVLRQNVPPEKREAWVQKKLDEEGIDVLITNPSLVETGLDLNTFTTLVYYNIGYNLFTFRQSSRRSWRINQTAPRIEVYILYYKGVMQARAIKLMASKLAAATLVEGNFTEEGLAGLADTGDMTSELAKELTKGIRDEVEDVSEMFKRMAIIKDETEADENEADYIIIDNAEEIPTETMAETPTQTPIIEIVSVSDKIKRAMLLAKQATQERQKTSVIDYPIYAENDGQFSLLDIAS